MRSALHVGALDSYYFCFYFIFSLVPKNYNYLQIVMLIVGTSVTCSSAHNVLTYTHTKKLPHVMDSGTLEQLSKMLDERDRKLTEQMSLLIAPIDQRLARLEERFARVEERIDNIESHLNNIDLTVQRMYDMLEEFY